MIHSWFRLIQNFFSVLSSTQNMTLCTIHFELLKNQIEPFFAPLRGAFFLQWLLWMINKHSFLLGTYKSERKRESSCLYPHPPKLGVACISSVKVNNLLKQTPPNKYEKAISKNHSQKNFIKKILYSFAIIWSFVVILWQRSKELGTMISHLPHLLSQFQIGLVC